MKLFNICLLLMLFPLSAYAQSMDTGYQNRIAAGFSFFYATNKGVPGLAYHTNYTHAFSEKFGGNLAISGLTGSTSDGTPFSDYESYSSIWADVGVFVHPLGKRLRLGTGLSYQYGHETYSSSVSAIEYITGERIGLDEDFDNLRYNRPGCYVKGEVFLFHTQNLSTAIALDVYSYFIRGYFGEIFTIGFHTGYLFWLLVYIEIIWQMHFILPYRQLYAGYSCVIAFCIAQVIVTALFSVVYENEASSMRLHGQPQTFLKDFWPLS